MPSVKSTIAHRLAEAAVSLLHKKQQPVVIRGASLLNEAFQCADAFSRSTQREVRKMIMPNIDKMNEILINEHGLFVLPINNQCLKEVGNKKEIPADAEIDAYIKWTPDSWRPMSGVVIIPKEIEDHPLLTLRLGRRWRRAMSLTRNTKHTIDTMADKGKLTTTDPIYGIQQRQLPQPD